MKGMKKNISNPKGAKSSSLNSKLSEDMVLTLLVRKIKLRMRFPFTTVATEDTLVAQI